MAQNKNQQKPPPMFAKDIIIEIFFKLDEFWKKFTRFSPKCIEQTDRKKRHYPSGYRCLKHFYLNEVCGNMKDIIQVLIQNIIC